MTITELLMRHQAQWVSYRSQRPRSFSGEAIDDVAVDRENKLIDCFLRDLDTIIAEAKC